MIHMQVSTYAVGGWQEPSHPIVEPVPATPWSWSYTLPQPSTDEREAAIERDVARLKSLGLKTTVALRVLAALDWDGAKALAVAKAAIADGVDVVELAKQIGGTP